MPPCSRAQHTCRQSASRLEGTRFARGGAGLTLRTAEAQGSHNESNVGPPLIPSLPTGGHCVPPTGAKGGKTTLTCIRKARARMGRGPMGKEGAECSSLPAIERYHDLQTSFPQRAWKSRAGMWGESAWRSIASVDLLCWFLRPRPASWSAARRLAFAAVPSVQWVPEPWRMHTRHREEETR